MNNIDHNHLVRPWIGKKGIKAKAFFNKIRKNLYCSTGNISEGERIRNIGIHVLVFDAIQYELYLNPKLNMIKRYKEMVNNINKKDNR